MTDLHQQIADLEVEIDALFDAAERCRKSMVVAKAATVIGVLLLGGGFLGVIRAEPWVFVGGIAAALAGIGFYGSSRGSLEQIAARVRDCELRRSRMIDELGLALHE